MRMCQREKELGIAGIKRKADDAAGAGAGLDLAAATKRTVEVSAALVLLSSSSLTLAPPVPIFLIKPEAACCLRCLTIVTRQSIHVGVRLVWEGGLCGVPCLGFLLSAYSLRAAAPQWYHTCSPCAPTQEYNRTVRNKTLVEIHKEEQRKKAIAGGQRKPGEVAPGQWDRSEINQTRVKDEKAVNKMLQVWLCLTCRGLARVAAHGKHSCLSCILSLWLHSSTPARQPPTLLRPLLCECVHAFDAFV